LYDSEPGTWFNQSDAGSRVSTACMIVSPLFEVIVYILFEFVAYRVWLLPGKLLNRHTYMP